MTPEERMEILSVLSSLLGYAEGFIESHFLSIGEAELGKKRISESGEIQRAKALLRKMAGEG